MKVFLTGGHGFIGSRVVSQLLDEGHGVRCLVRSTSDTARIDGLTWERVVGDVRDADSLREGMHGCDAVIHLASPSSWNDINSPAMSAIVEGGTQNVLEAAGERPVVFASSIIAVGASEGGPVIHDESSPFNLTDPSLVYAHAKNRAEELCRLAASKGQHVVIVNPAEVYGPEDTGMVTAGNLVDFAKSRPVFVSHGGTSVVHVDDVANGTIRALEKGRSGERYILGGDNLTVRQLAELTLELLGLDRSVIAVPTPILRGLASAGSLLRIPLPFNPLVIPYATRYFFMNNQKATEELGVTFRGARAVLEPTLEWLRGAGHIA
ncbi:MAG: NAD-dependent epimerase/dehydratase family protein [Deltaproteobacteria bacterium]|nr:MAG: NAD-dependent epimerase/dehydratase family protein [Deltaproteobacteria bacterium]